MDEGYTYLSGVPCCEPPLGAIGEPCAHLPVPGTRHRPLGGRGAAQSSPHDGRSPTRAAMREPAAPRDSSAFAELAIRRALEVVDRRRNPNQLRTFFAPEVVEHLHRLATAGARRGSRGTAILQTVHLRPVHSGPPHPAAGDSGPAEVVEFFGRYARGERSPAFAGRMEQTAGGWRVTSLLFA